MSEFKHKYLQNLSDPSIVDCFANMCSGWTQETFKQVILTLTKKGQQPIKLWFDSVEDMYPMSNKREALGELF